MGEMRMSQVTPETFLSALLHNQKLPSSLFGQLLRQILQIIGLKQGDLELLARKEYTKLIAGGYIDPTERLGSMDQTVISRVSRNTQAPTPAQVYCWIEALKKSQELLHYCSTVQADNPRFLEDLETALWNGTEYKSPKELAWAYNFATKLSQTPKNNSERNTDVNINSVPRLTAVHPEPTSDSIPNATFEVRRALEKQC
jgi:hypothetical protein